MSTKFVVPSDAHSPIHRDVELEILWDFAPVRGIPTGGFGLLHKEETSQKVLFMTILKNSYEESLFLIYSLPSTSIEILEADQLRFRNTVGNIRDYTAERQELVFDGRCEFYHSFKLEELPVNECLGKIEFRQIRNPYPKFILQVDSLKKTPS